MKCTHVFYFLQVIILHKDMVHMRNLLIGTINSHFFNVMAGSLPLNYEEKN